MANLNLRKCKKLKICNYLLAQTTHVTQTHSEENQEIENLTSKTKKKNIHF